MNRFNGPVFRLFFISFLALFAEFLLIRWLPLQFILLGYFSNLILISALLGLGIGMLAFKEGKRRLIDFMPHVFASLAVFLVIILAASPVFLPLSSSDYFVWNGLSRQNSAGVLPYLVLIIIFSASASIFFIFGKEIGAAWRGIDSLKGYLANIAGSVFGVALFSLLSVVSTPPVLWFASFFLLYFIYYRGCLGEKTVNLSRSFFALLALVSIFSLTAGRGGEFYWSPYYEIRKDPIAVDGKQAGFNISVNSGSHQQALDLSGSIKSPFLESRKNLYELPYKIFAKPCRDVLILGAGTGNDVSAALRMGAEHVDAVEIDPVIARLAKEHPEYEETGRANFIIDDARAYLERTEKKYDLISFGFADSHRLFSSMSSIRLENYLYTTENMENLYRSLNEGGILSITYTVHEKWIAQRIYRLLASSFKQEPLAFQGDKNAWGTTFMVRKGEPLLPLESYLAREDLEKSFQENSGGSTWGYSDVSGYLPNEIFSGQTRIPSDDWPHLFLKQPGIPLNYLLVLIFVLASSLALLFSRARLVKEWSFGAWGLFFMGAAFALIETKGIVDSAIVLGTTWFTSVVVTLGIFLMAFLSTLLVIKKQRISAVPVLAILIAIILFNYFYPLKNLGEYSYFVRALFVGFQVSLPVFFSSVLFAIYFKEVKNPGVGLGANLLGTVFGGIFEYSSMAWGSRILFLFAILFYILAFFAFSRDEDGRNTLAQKVKKLLRPKS